MKSYVIVAFLNDIKSGFQFKLGHWPLHITLAASFDVPVDEEGLINYLDQWLKTTTAINTKGTKEILLGPNKNIPVIEVKLNDQLRALHNLLITNLEKIDAKFKYPQQNYSSYIPHVTNQVSERIYPGHLIVIDSVSLVRKTSYDNNRHYNVVARVNLK